MTHYSRIFIDGANGMLGTTLKSLIDNNKLFLTDKELSENIVYCDIRDLNHTSQLVKEYQPDIILNIAAVVDLEYAEQEKDDCYLTNTIAAINLFNLSKPRVFSKGELTFFIIFQNTLYEKIDIFNFFISIILFSLYNKYFIDTKIFLDI